MPLISLLIVGGAFFSLVFIIWYWFSPKHLEVGYQPKQPIPYDHSLHAGELGIDCRYCHVSVDVSAKASVPSSEICLNCHNVVKKDSPHILKIRESVAKNEPLEWKKVHHLADYAYFNHSRHVNSGIGCATCHGRIDQMKEVRQVQPLSMGWCLECHRNPEKFIRPKSEITNMSWTAEDQEKLGKELVALYHVSPREDCSTCHR